MTGKRTDCATLLEKGAALEEHIMQDISKLKRTLDSWNRACPYHLIYSGETRHCADPIDCMLNVVESRGGWHCAIEREERDGTRDGSVVNVVDPNDHGLTAKIAHAGVDHSLATAVEMHRLDGVALFASPSARLCVEGAQVDVIRSTRIDDDIGERTFIFAVHADGRYQELEVHQLLETDGTVTVDYIRQIVWPSMRTQPN